MNFKTLALGGAAAIATLATTLTANAAVVDTPTFKVGGLVVVWGGDASGANAVASDFYLLNGTSGTQGTDLIAGDVIGDIVTTGDLLPTLDGNSLDANSDGVLDASDSLAPFAVTQSTDVDSGGANNPHRGQFFVASNTGFQIHAQAVETVNTFPVTGVGPLAVNSINLSNVDFDMTLDAPATATPILPGASLNFGGAAQDPQGSAAGFATFTDLAALEGSAPVLVYSAARRTAAAVGNLAAQSVRFNTSYRFDADKTTAGVQGFDLSAGTGELEATVTYTIYNP